MIEALVSFGAERDAITRDAGWYQLDVDSLDLVEVAQIVEDEYGGSRSSPSGATFIGVAIAWNPPRATRASLESA